MHFKRHIVIPIDPLATTSAMSSSAVEPNSPQATGSRAAAVEKLYVLGIPLHNTSQSFQFIIATAGVMLFFLLYGYIQEWIFRIDGFKPVFGWYLTLIQFGCYTIFGTGEMLVTGAFGHRKISLCLYGLIAFLTVATIGLSNTAVGYLNYPTQVIFKSCKLIPVMIGGVIIQGKSYGTLDVIATLCMTIGLMFFTLADSLVQPNFNITGVVLISLALCADAVIGNVQEKTLKQSSISEMVYYSYSMGFVYIVLGLLLTGVLQEAIQYSAMHIEEVYGLAVLFSLTGYLGVNCVLVLLKCSGALTTVTVTTFRKALSIVISFLFFTKPFTLQYVWSGMIVLMGVALNVYNKNYNDINNWIYDRWCGRTRTSIKQVV